MTALHEVRLLIVEGKLSPGTWIAEDELAKRLHLSRTPARAALQWLQQEGYLQVRRTGNKSRVVVSPLTKQDANELYAVIGRLEGLAARKATQLPKPERLALAEKLRDLNQRLAEIKVHPSQQAAIFDIARDFHRLIVESGAGPRMRSLHNTIEPQVERYWRLYASSIVGNLQLSIDEHNAIISALIASDADGIDRALQLNWENGRDRLAQVIDIFGERGSW
ncbi:MAG TPA: GntR family transcriptional regulator [Acidobacteriaceae bacterium]|nr:GntR family transcriptional regulator [Acidobacteriaceae bacterium]